jgi:hypothetical protein
MAAESPSKEAIYVTRAHGNDENQYVLHGLACSETSGRFIMAIYSKIGNKDIKYYMVLEDFLRTYKLMVLNG